MENLSVLTGKYGDEGDRFESEPGAVLGADGAVGSLDLRVVKDGFTEEKRTVGSPDKVVKGMV